MNTSHTKLLLFILFLALTLPITTISATQKINLVINGEYFTPPQDPILENGTVLVPVRGIFEALGAEMIWDASTQSITAKKDSTFINLQLNNPIAYIDDKETKLNIPPQLLNGTTMVPLRFIGESLGLEVNWDQPNQKVIVGKDINALSEQVLYKRMIALKKDYPEGMPWTNDNFYAWNGELFSGGYGCAGFAFLLSDAAFGSLPARKHEDFTNLRVGDILRINNDTHSVIILDIEGTTITVAEGNYNSSIHWGRQFTLDTLQARGTYVLTRYPEY